MAWRGRFVHHAPAVRVDIFDFELPESQVASEPCAERDGARLLHVGAASLTDARVVDLPDLVPPGSLLVVNDTRVIPARLLGHKADTGGAVEVLLVRRARADELAGLTIEPPGAEAWLAMGRSSKPLRVGGDLRFDDGGELAGRVLRREADGLLVVGLHSPAGRPIDEAIDAHGHVPLPPYVKRPDEPADRQRYQTVYARVPGAVAAPTAGLHITNALLDRLASRGVRVASITLHVGLGTFRPVQVDDLDDHPMHAEWVDVAPATCEAIAAARARGARVFAVGTTVVRALESAADGLGGVRPFTGDTRLLIQPGFAFKVVDGLFTNFHLPRSTLLALVCAFGGTTRVLAAYRHAVAAGYRFYSYGDAMLLTDRAPPSEAAT